MHPSPELCNQFSYQHVYLSLLFLSSWFALVLLIVLELALLGCSHFIRVTNIPSKKGPCCISSINFSQKVLFLLSLIIVWYVVMSIHIHIHSWLLIICSRYWLLLLVTAYCFYLGQCELHCWDDYWNVRDAMDCICIDCCWVDLLVHWRSFLLEGISYQTEMQNHNRWNQPRNQTFGNELDKGR